MKQANNKWQIAKHTIDKLLYNILNLSIAFIYFLKLGKGKLLVMIVLEWANAHSKMEEQWNTK